MTSAVCALLDLSPLACPQVRSAFTCHHAIHCSSQARQLSVGPATPTSKQASTRPKAANRSRDGPRRSVQVCHASVNSGKATAEDAAYMRRAVELALQAEGHTSPNPMVGCVIVKDGKVIGEGFHPKAGEPHAEVFALRGAGDRAAGATAYVSLEPCNHYGRTPPCSQALVKAKVSKVVVGMVDPNPLVAGNGLKTLQAAGTETVACVEEDLCQRVNEGFVHRMLHNKPFGILRSSITVDGQRVSPVKNSPGSVLSKLLKAADVAVVPGEAVTSSGPSLLSQEPGAKQPLRVIMAPSPDFPLNVPLLDTSLAPTMVITTDSALAQKPDLKAQLQDAGVELVIQEAISVSAVLSLFFDRGASLVLWQADGGWLEQLAVAEEAVQKVVTEILLQVGGGKAVVASMDVTPATQWMPVRRTSMETAVNSYVIESYVK